MIQLLRSQPLEEYFEKHMLVNDFLANKILQYIDIDSFEIVFYGTFYSVKRENPAPCGRG